MSFTPQKKTQTASFYASMPAWLTLQGFWCVIIIYLLSKAVDELDKHVDKCLPQDLCCNAKDITK